MNTHSPDIAGADVGQDEFEAQKHVIVHEIPEVVERIQDKIVEMIKVNPQERVQQRTSEQAVDYDHLCRRTHEDERVQVCRHVELEARVETLHCEAAFRADGQHPPRRKREGSGM